MVSGDSFSAILRHLPNLFCGIAVLRIPQYPLRINLLVFWLFNDALSDSFNRLRRPAWLQPQLGSFTCFGQTIRQHNPIEPELILFSAIHWHSENNNSIYNYNLFNKLTSGFHSFVVLFVMNFVITSSK